ncbi:ABC transporter permease [Knoellia sp. p5-6-4]|uniref:ABC transporter permease n=1 Tax=unclassified Knoellia TaxID=2618719 RepID=UPI0023DBCF1A|nr:ABC transporter permease [Knoellia sp. p5-6-4]MDF2143429.1 ABC transporter permease [Knoellia sp. p5-6-4]
MLVIALKDLRQRLRDRSALVLGFIAPLAVAWLVSAAFGSTGSFHMDVGVVDRDGGQVAAGFQSFLRSPELSDLLTVTVVPSEAEARAKVDDGTLSAAFVVPEGFTPAVVAGGGRPITVLGSVDSTIATQVSTSLAASFTAQVETVRLSVATAVDAGAPHEHAAALAEAASRIPPPESVAAQSASTRTIDAISYYAPGMGIFFMLFAISFGSRGYFLERAGGTMERLDAAPITSGAVLLGKSLATFVYGLASLGTVALFTSLVFGADWGPWPAVVALVVALSLVLVGLTALVIALARTERQAEGLSSILVFGLVLLGGNFIFISAAPPLLRSLSLLTPNGWALRAFTDLAGGADWTAVVTPVLVLLAFALATGGAAVALRRRALTP